MVGLVRTGTEHDGIMSVDPVMSSDLRLTVSRIALARNPNL